MLFFYYGEDSFRAKQKIEAIITKFKDKVDMAGQNVQKLDGEIISADDFFQAVSVMGFLADKKLIIIKNLFSNKKLKNWQDSLIDFLKKQANTTEENYIIFWETSKPDRRGKLFKFLAKLDFAEEFNKLTGLKLNSWIKNQVTQQNRTIADQALTKLISYVGNDLWQLHNEIGKLSNNTKDEITEEQVKDLVQAKVDESIFNLIDAIGNKNKSLALQLIEDKLNSGVNHQYILTMITRQFRLLIKTKLLASQIKHSSALSQTLKIHPLVAEKTLSQSKLYTLEQLKSIYRKLLILDEKFKTTQNQEKILFAKIINDL